MKVKRIIVSIIMAISCIVTMAIVASASDQYTIENTSQQVNLSAYVAGFDWPLFLEDKIYYWGSISGQNVSLLIDPNLISGDSNKVYIRPYSDKASLDKVYLWNDRQSVHETNGVSCGIGVTSVHLYMWDLNCSHTLNSALD